MVHRIFKNIVPRTNRKNIDLDLLKRYTTLFAIRHLIDGGVDNRFSFTNNAFTNLPHHLRRMMNDWFIVETSFDTEEDMSEGLVNLNLVYKYCIEILLTIILYILFLFHYIS